MKLCSQFELFGRRFWAVLISVSISFSGVTAGEIKTQTPHGPAPEVVIASARKQDGKSQVILAIPRRDAVPSAAGTSADIAIAAAERATEPSSESLDRGTIEKQRNRSQSGQDHVVEYTIPLSKDGIKGSSPSGKKIAQSELIKRLEKPTQVLLIRSGGRFDPYYAPLYRDDVIVLHGSPEMFTDRQPEATKSTIAAPVDAKAMSKPRGRKKSKGSTETQM